MNDLFVLFVVLNVVNVILQTIKSLATVKCGKSVAAVVNALAYGIYTVVLVYMNCDLTLFDKVIVVSLSNLIGVYVVKTFEEKLQKDKLWKIDVTVNSKYKDVIINSLEEWNIPYNYNDYRKHCMFSIFAQTQLQSEYVGKLVKLYKGKYFISENKGIL